MQKIWFWAITVALGGFLFGFDTAVISGVNGIIKAEWGLSDAALGQMVAAALYGTILGALCGGFPANRYGRKASLLGVALLFLVSAIGSALAADVVQLGIFRFIGGIGVGASSVVAPLYITEMAPAKLRGQLVAAFQFNLVVGILVAYLSNYVIDAVGWANNWRLMLGVEIIPATLYLVLLFFVPRSPRWLLLKGGNREEALATLRAMDASTAEAELASIEAANQGHRAASVGEFFSGKYRRPILYAFLFALFNQISGINAVIYYAPDIFASAGLERSSSLLSSVGIGVVNVVGTLLGMYLIDLVGRRKLMYLGSFGYLLSLGAVAYAFFSGNVAGIIVPIWLFVFIASHAIGQGAVIWVFISEIFGNEVRSLGASLGSSTHWVFAALISGVFPYFSAQFGQGPIFAFFAVCMLGQLAFVHWVMPETKGVNLEVLQRQLEE
ncbi:sugar porter family MFS transporter [Lewinella lacunae]|uniref:Sugar porter family MFS transporter n=2 Tax=Neolewinella lacunae TaxID=1517758 RepID=A0A923T7W9_9BACT|nr:sugar porter family MFS transporter [Neolewinella lacunae]